MHTTAWTQPIHSTYNSSSSLRPSSSAAPKLPLLFSFTRVSLSGETELATESSALVSSPPTHTASGAPTPKRTPYTGLDYAPSNCWATLIPEAQRLPHGRTDKFVVFVPAQDT